MTTDAIARRGLVLIGCGRMGSALLRGWLRGGIPARAVHVHEPAPSAWLSGTGVAVNAPLPDRPAVAVLAVKPQLMDSALPDPGWLGAETLVISIAAGIRLARLETALGADRPIVRAMPNTPAAIGHGITAIVGNAHADAAALAMAETLMQAAGAVVRLDDEAQMDAVTALSGSGPAYVFHLIEAMAAAGEAQGLGADLAMRLARATVVGAARLAEAEDTPAADLRAAVTSPGGTTAAGLAVLMDRADGLPQLMARTVEAAAARSAELAQ